MIEPLTPHEDRVLKLIAAGKTNSEMAGILERSIKTVEKHRNQIFSKFGVSTPGGAVMEAFRRGLLTTFQ